MSTIGSTCQVRNVLIGVGSLRRQHFDMKATMIATIDTHPTQAELITCRQCPLDTPLILIEPSGLILHMNRAAQATIPDERSWVGRPSAQLAQWAPWQTVTTLTAQALTGQVATDLVRDKTGRSWEIGCRVLPDRWPMALCLTARDVT